MRLLSWVIAGLCLGGIIHVVIIMLLPLNAQRSLFSQISTLTKTNDIRVIEPSRPGQEKIIFADPALIHAVCSLDLTNGPGVISGSIMNYYWSLGVFNDKGQSFYALTSHSTHTLIDVGLFNAAQYRYVHSQKYPLPPSRFTIKAPSDKIFAVIRVLPSRIEEYELVKKELEAFRCQSIDIDSLAGIENTNMQTDESENEDETVEPDSPAN